MARLKRKSLSEQLVLAITEDIAAGVWTEELPGYRVLEKRYEVSRPICERAMRVLEANGIIGPAKPGKMRPILRKKDRNQAPATRHLLIVIDSRHPPSPLDAELVTQVEDFWKTRGGDVSRVSADLMRSQKPEYQLNKWLKMTGADCLFFETIADEWIEPVENLGLPCYAMGGDLREGAKVLSGSGYRITPVIEKLLRETLELGHRRILLVMGRATNEKEMRRVIQEMAEPVLAKHGGGQEVSFFVMIPDLANPRDWHDWWQATMRSKRPTVVLTECVFQAICLHDFCLAQGLQMPRDMSIIVLEDAEFLEWLNPAPTRYRYQAKEGFRHFQNWVRGGFAPGSIKFLGADLAGGQTLGPAPERVPEIGE